MCGLYLFITLCVMCVEAEENSQEVVASLCPPALHPQACAMNAFTQ